MKAEHPRKLHVKKKRCKVLSVYDGDTLHVEWDESAWLGLVHEVKPVKVRLAYIDTPEMRYHQAGAAQAKDVLAKMLTGRYVILEYAELPNGEPRKCDFNRVLAVAHLQRTFLPNANINEFLLKKGYARLYPNPDNVVPHQLKRMQRAERSARWWKRGIWRYANAPSRNGGGAFWYLALGILIGVALTLLLLNQP